ncbi:fibrinogen silencer-binding protein [Callorhinchus milii]|uniref:Fibrinogen silencer binding protein n=1 Tax=Callorhinchus milii TaxID=7868 RepID=A0A4W3GVN7_CALMI|nr:fibrinogen silencer-binding protein [Callorhinchus milii]|eukprot:gi/632941909/ref/XP_007886127.1/ PREDICTED: fibrinogen silencer-binding protein [Callorhinchus milii]
MCSVQNMLGKKSNRSSNFTIYEKIDLLKLVRPHIKVLEVHKNNQAIIVEKNRCWESIAQQYNAVGVDRPPRSAQALRTLYKRIKESAKQEVARREQLHPDYKGNVSEPTRRILEMIPHIFQPLLKVMDSDSLQRRGGSSASEQDSCVEQPSTLYLQPGPSGYQSHSCPDWITPESEPEHEEKPPPILSVVSPPTESLEQQNKTDTQQATNGSASPSSSCDAQMSLTPSPQPARREDVLFSHHHHQGGVLRHMAGRDNGEMQLMSSEEHEIIMENQRKFGLYLDEKREILKSKQVLEEDLLRARIRVEELRAARLQQGLPDLKDT